MPRVSIVVMARVYRCHSASSVQANVDIELRGLVNRVSVGQLCGTPAVAL